MFRLHSVYKSCLFTSILFIFLVNLLADAVAQQDNIKSRKHFVQHASSNSPQVAGLPTQVGVAASG